MDESFLSILEERDCQRKMVFDRIFDKYDKEHPTDDVLDFQTMTIVEDNGHLRSMKAASFGSKQLASSTIIEKYMKELEKEKIKKSSSRATTSSPLRIQKSISPSWCEDDIQENEASDLCLESYPSNQKSGLQVFGNMLQSFQSCAENIIGDLIDARRQKLEVSFGKKKCSLKNSFSWGNQQFDMTLQVSTSDKVPSQNDFYASSPVEPIFRNLFSADKNKSILMNLFHCMRMMSSRTSLVSTTPLKSQSGSPMCHILTMKSKKATDSSEKDTCSVRKFQSRNLKAINYSPVNSTLIDFGALTPLGTIDAIYAEKKLCSNQKFQSRNLTSITYSPIKSRSIHLNASTLLGTNDASCAKEKLLSHQKLRSKNLKAINYSPVSSTSINFNASTSLGTRDASYSKEKLRSNQECHSKNLKAINYSPVKLTSVHLNTSTPLDTSDTSYPEEKFCSNQKFLSKNLKAINYSPVKSTSIHLNASTPSGTNDASCAKEKLLSHQKLLSKNLKAINYSPVSSTSINFNASTPSRKRSFVADDELNILKTKKICNKNESNAAKSNTRINGRKSDFGTCITPSVERHNEAPLCDLLKTLDILPSGKSLKITAAKTPKKHESNLKDLNNKSICILENSPRPR